MNNYVSTAKSEEARVGWNWGAFMLPFPFGIGNKAYLCLLALVPFLNFVWYFVSGALGARWAYESGEFGSVNEFNAAMRTWNRAGLVMFVISMVSMVFVLLYVTFAFSMFSSILSAIS